MTEVRVELQRVIMLLIANRDKVERTGTFVAPLHAYAHKDLPRPPRARLLQATHVNAELMPLTSAANGFASDEKYCGEPHYCKSRVFWHPTDRHSSFGQLRRCSAAMGQPSTLRAKLHQTHILYR